MPTIDDEIDQLFELPPGEFTAARNALAKRAGAHAADVKALQKPTTPAWAVNQLYWKRRRVFDRLVAAALAVRTAHTRQFAGKPVDVAQAEAAHREAQKAAADEIRELLKEAGEAATPATLSAVTETLLALPTDEPPGRLTKPLKPQGFEALLGMAAQAGVVAASPWAAAATVLHGAPPQTVRPTTAADTKRQKAEEAAARQAAEARRRELADLDKRLNAAKHAESDAGQALARTRQALADAEQTRSRLEKDLVVVGDRLIELRDALTHEQPQADKATKERREIERQIAALSDD